VAGARAAYQKAIDCGDRELARAARIKKITLRVWVAASPLTDGTLPGPQSDRHAHPFKILTLYLSTHLASPPNSQAVL
jgi:hypothetical protein